MPCTDLRAHALAVQQWALSVVLHDQDSDVGMADAVTGGGADNESDEAAFVVCSHCHECRSELVGLLADELPHALAVGLPAHDAHMVWHLRASPGVSRGVIMPLTQQDALQQALYPELGKTSGACSCSLAPCAQRSQA